MTESDLDEIEAIIDAELRKPQGCAICGEPWYAALKTDGSYALPMNRKASERMERDGGYVLLCRKHYPVSISQAAKLKGAA